MEGILINNSSGSNSISNGYKRTILYKPDTLIALAVNNIITLNNSFANYDNIEIEWYYSNNSSFAVTCNKVFSFESLKNIKELRENSNLNLIETVLTGYSAVAVGFVPISYTEFKITELLGSYTKYITSITGIKY